MTYHRFAELFPLIDGDQFNELVQSIKSNGLREKIWTTEGQILDGRNRYRACIEAGVAPEFREYDGDDPLRFVIDLNMSRRHLDESQRALVAAKIATLERGDFHGNQHAKVVSANLPTPQNSKNTEENGHVSENGVVSQDEAAALLNVSSRSVRAAKAATKEGSPALQKLMADGKIKVSAAEQIAKAYDHRTQDAIVQLIREGRSVATAIKEATAKPQEAQAPPPALKDKLGNPIPESLLPVFADERFRDIDRFFSGIRDTLKAICADPAGFHLRTHVDQSDKYFAKGLQHLRYSFLDDGRPYCVCVSCGGTGKKKNADCQSCKGCGWLTRHKYRQVADNAHGEALIRR